MHMFLIAFFALLIIMSIMAVGVILGRKPISGSCGGVGAALGQDNYVCELCGDDEAKCEEISSLSNTKANNFDKNEASTFYEADKKRLF